jgi:hypothetical protein
MIDYLRVEILRFLRLCSGQVAQNDKRWIPAPSTMAPYFAPHKGATQGKQDKFRRNDTLIDYLLFSIGVEIASSLRFSQ